MNIIWTIHAKSRQLDWETKLGIKKDDIEKIINFPQQIVDGDLNALVAQSKFNNGLIRVPFVQQGDSRKILTVYWTSKIERYWKEGKT